MARKPRKAAASGKAEKAGRTSGRRGVSALALVVFLLVLGAGAGVAWLSFTYQPPLRPGMPGNDLVLELGDEAKAVAKPIAGDPAAKARNLAADDDKSDDASSTETAAATTDTPVTDESKPGARAQDDQPSAPTPDDQAAEDPKADDSAAQSATAASDTATPANESDDSTSQPAATDDTATAPTDSASPSTDQAAAAPADSGDQGTGQTAPVKAPAPQGQPQRQPVGQETAMRLNVPQPNPGVKPRVAIVLTGLGLSKAQTNAAIQALPANITFAFSPYGNDLQAWADQAREAGHEVLLELPMEPHGFPNDDPGPHTLLTSLTENENVERMTWVLDRFTGYVGVTSQLGGRFTTQPESLRPILVELKKRGLLFLDTRASPDSVAGEIAVNAGLAHANNDVFLDEAAAARATINAGLAELERIARERGSAIGIGYPFPVTMEMLANWARDLEGRDIELLPVSALARLPAAR
ncbi:MAG: divergent polysaccharide deacetylase family protein [Alphaproteobacteria bacterium]